MKWKNPETYATLGALVAGVVTAFGLVTPDEASSIIDGAVQVAGGVLAIIAGIAAVRQRKQTDDTPSARRR